MNASAKTGAAYFNYIGSIELPLTIAHACSHPGPCDADVKRAMQLPEIKEELKEIDPDALRKELSEYGAWEPSELKNHQTNLERILWIAAGNIIEGN